jgi:hypothetical protein
MSIWENFIIRFSGNSHFQQCRIIIKAILHKAIGRTFDVSHERFPSLLKFYNNKLIHLRFIITVLLSFINFKERCVGFEVQPAMVMKSSIFWNITSCSPLKVNRRFGGVSHKLSTYYQADFLPGLLFDP